jgi:hypothetical protein
MKRLITLLFLLTGAFATSGLPAWYHAYAETEFHFDRDLLCALTDAVEGERRIPGLAVENEKEYPTILSDPERYEGRVARACESATLMRRVLDRAKAILSTIQDTITSVVH